MRTVGVEEELLLVRGDSGQALSVAPQVLQRADLLERERPAEDFARPGPGKEPEEAGSSLGGELQRQQVETDTAPHRTMTELSEELVSWRALADASARREGARVAALGTSPVPVEPRVGHTERYRDILRRFGVTASEQLSCGCHVHVGVDSDEEAIAVLDRIRVWLPPLLALTTNSPYWQGMDSSYASYRSQIMARWPTSGPPDLYGSPETYHRLVQDMIASDVITDPGMVYLDARPSAHYPTLEIRVADVCQDVRDTVLLAALCRALVQTGSAGWSAGEPAPQVPTPMVRLATWQAGRYGLSGELLDPLSCRPRPAAEVLESLVSHVRPALEQAGDLELVGAGVERLHRVGTGAERQRRVLERTSSLSDVVAAAVRTTNGQEEES